MIFVPGGAGVCNSVVENVWYWRRVRFGVRWRLILFLGSGLQVTVCEIVLKLGAFVIDISSTRPFLLRITTSIVLGKLAKHYPIGADP